MRFIVTLFFLAATPVVWSAEPFCGTGKPHPIDVRNEQESKKIKGFNEGVTVAIRESLGNLHQAWDKELNAQYKKLMEVLKPEDRDTLKQAQRAWLSFVLSEEKLLQSGSVYGETGTSGLINMDGAGVTMVRDRTCQLIQYREAIEVFR